MTCAAAASLVYERLPPNSGHPVSDVHIFSAINWWTIDTIREALTYLMDLGAAEAESTTRGILYRRTKEQWTAK